MAIQIINGSGDQYPLVVNPDGSINAAAVTGAPDSGYNPKIVIQYVGSMIGSIYKNLSTGSLVQVLTYDAGSNIVAVSPWTVV